MGEGTISVVGIRKIAVGNCHTKRLRNVVSPYIPGSMLGSSSNICTPRGLVILAEAVVIAGYHTQLIYGSNSIRLGCK